LNKNLILCDNTFLYN